MSKPVMTGVSVTDAAAHGMGHAETPRVECEMCGSTVYEDEAEFYIMRSTTGRRLGHYYLCRRCDDRRYTV